MYVITGITGQVGGATARQLLAKNLPVRAVVRSAEKGEKWAKLGCEVALADLSDHQALTRAFESAEAVFILLPPNFDPAPGFPEASLLATSVKKAIDTAKPKRVVYLSTIGADAREENLLTQHSIAESILNQCDTPITFLRAAWFMENSQWDIPVAQADGVFNSFLQPLNKKIAIVATTDIGEFAAELLQTDFKRHQIIELEGPERISPNQMAEALSKAVGHVVKAHAVPRESWENLFKAQGMKNPTPRARMLDGFNEGWIDFKNAKKSRTTFEDVLARLVKTS